MNNAYLSADEGNSAHYRGSSKNGNGLPSSLSIIIMLIIYVGFILLIAFAPHWLGTPLHEGTSVTRGIPIGIGVIIISFVLTGVYALACER